MPRTGYSPVAIDNFAGLDVRSDPEDANPVRAIDMLNVDLEKSGRIKSRPGTTKIVSQSSTANWNSLFTYVAGGLNNPHTISVIPSLGTLVAFNASTGSSVTTFSAVGASLPARISCATMFGVPTASAVMYLNVDGGTYLIKYNGTTFSSVTAVSGGAKHMAVQLPDNRLVLANSGIATTNSRVVFSAANNPESFNTTDDYVDLFPGDGEEIVGLANYGNYLFAFKQSTFFRFYGNSTDQTGGTVFNYDFQKHNLGTPAAATRICVAGREGVYFLAKDGVYVTTGGPPRKVSQPLDPLFRGVDEAGYFSSRTVTTAIGAGLFPTCQLQYADGKLFLIPGGDSTLFMYDPQLNQWTYWELLSGRGMTIYGASPVLLAGAAREVPAFLMVNGGPTTFESVISRLDPAVNNDAAHAVQVTPQFVYRTNFLDLGQPASMKTVREIMIDGYLSAVGVAVSVDSAVNAFSAFSDTLITRATGNPAAPTWPNYYVGQARTRKAARGSNFSLRFGGGSTTVVQRAVFHLRNARPAGPRVQT